MKQLISFFAVLLSAQISFAQNTFKATVKDEETKEAVAGATVSVKDTGVTATTDANGIAQLTNVPDGEQTIVIFSAGYEIK